MVRTEHIEPDVTSREVDFHGGATPTVDEIASLDCHHLYVIRNLNFGQSSCEGLLAGVIVE
jgi:hypothetical protein